MHLRTYTHAHTHTGGGGEDSKSYPLLYNQDQDVEDGAAHALLFWGTVLWVLTPQVTSVTGTRIQSLCAFVGLFTLKEH